MDMPVIEGEKLLERLCLWSQWFDINSSKSSVPCRLGMSIQGSFSGPAGFSSNPVGIGSRDGVSGVG